MCGLAGYCALKSSEFKTDPALLDALQKTLTHRGPDGSGTWYCDKQKIALIHRRLNIIDLSDAGAQPMMDADKSVIISFNGEIYNYKELRAELKALGYQFRSNTDTEVVIYAYKAWGIKKCLQKCDGMFAFALCDTKKDELYLVRDRIGIKPLYFSLQGGMLSFASEIKALWVLPWMRKELKHTALYHYLTYLVTPAPMTLFEGVYKLPPAFYMRVDKKRTITFHEWYNPIVTPAKIYDDEALCIEKIYTLLDTSIKKRMMADVPVGVFLSGGIYSSLNVALMAQYTDKLETFNVSFVDGPEYEERNWARKVAKKFNTEHHELIISEREAFTFFQKMVYHQDEPLGDCVCIPLYYVAKLAKDAGVTVVQVGEGSDELFCGYNSYTQYLNISPYWHTSQKYIPTFARRGLYYAASKMYQQNKNKVDLLKSWSQGRELFYSGALVFSELWKKDIVGQKNIEIKCDPIIEQIYPGFPQGFDSYAIADYHRDRLLQKNPDADPFKIMTYLELKHRLSELLLMRVDKMAMATSVEARVPFLDHTLIEFALQVPVQLKYKNGITKYILKKAAATVLPQEIINRKKIGFAAPATRWFKRGTYFRPFFMDMLISKNTFWQDVFDLEEIEKMMQENRGSVDYSYQLWALQNVMAFNYQ